MASVARLPPECNADASACGQCSPFSTHGCSGALISPLLPDILCVMGDNGQSRLEPTKDTVAIYHVVYEHEDFNHAANALFTLVQRAQHLQPGKKRKLFLDIEGHRNSKGGFDADMLELQKEFLTDFL